MTVRLRVFVDFMILGMNGEKMNLDMTGNGDG